MPSLIGFTGSTPLLSVPTHLLKSDSTMGCAQSVSVCDERFFCALASTSTPPVDDEVEEYLPSAGRDSKQRENSQSKQNGDGRGSSLGSVHAAAFSFFPTSPPGFDLDRPHPMEPPFLGCPSEDGDDEDIHPSPEKQALMRKDIEDDAERYQQYRAALPKLFQPITPNQSARKAGVPGALNHNRSPCSTPDSAASFLTSTTVSSNGYGAGKDSSCMISTDRNGRIDLEAWEESSGDLVIDPHGLGAVANARTKAKSLFSFGRGASRRLFEPSTPTAEKQQKRFRPKKHSTLPSKKEGCPIHLKVCAEHPVNLSQEEWATSSDFFSFVPICAGGKFAVRTPTDEPWGGGLSIDTQGSNRIEMKNGSGETIATMRPRHTFVPSYVLYSSKPRYRGQYPSSHRGGGEARGHVRTHFGADNDEEEIVFLYPWALIKKDGRELRDSVSIHMAQKHEAESDGLNDSFGNTSLSNDLAGFSEEPTFRSRHGFDGHGFVSHTLVSRIDYAYNSTAPQEIACCLILPNPVKDGIYDITIAPGVDPVLILCYLSVHANVDKSQMGVQ